MENNLNYIGTFDTPPENPLPGQWYLDSNGEKWICSIDGTQWLKISENADGSINTGLTKYELNKMVIEQMPEKTTNGQLKEYKEILKQFIQENKDTYYMLLCNDIHYYTVVKRVKDQNIVEFHNLIIELLNDTGHIKYIDWTDDDHNAIECWVSNENGTFMFMLFPYDWGVVECV